MVDLQAGLGERLQAEVTTLAMCWRVVRRDGVGLGFTTHDRPLVIAGMAYESAPGMTPSAVVINDDIEVDTMEVEGALSADAISAADLAEGRYDGAGVRLFMVDWQAPDAAVHVLATGRLGTVAAGSGADAGFTATLRGPTAVLAATAIETYSPECRAELGDHRCRVAMRGRTLRALVGSSDGGSIGVLDMAETEAANYSQGRLRVLAGPAAGLERRIIGAEAGRLLLDEPLSLASGTAIELREGCDKRFATCTGRFANALNFRGEPHVPGGDLLTRFAGL